MKTDLEAMVELILQELKRQEIEFDNLGDGDSIVFCGECPTLNVTEFAQRILEGMIGTRT